jgi:hypothetical protein
MDKQEQVIELSNGDITLWIADGDAIHLRAVTKFGDPVEINSEEAKEMIEALRRLIREIEQ